ncbi:uncharacterized protein LOC117113110 [Anneissia japonica]|uniref:uncharacterized protein LOC117113110 n=1 Tax=Anneissia japonica TaxID=1529436 RepID=UPI00142592FD|nr:uncharacterized protein LOC117113110 [Anneissia japonica]
MTTRMAIPMERSNSGYHQLGLDDRIAYGNIPKWIVQGMDIPNLYDPQATFKKQTTLPPVYAGNRTGILQANNRRPDPQQLKAFTVTSRDLPWASGGKMSSYLPSSKVNIMLLDSPYAYSTSHLGQQPQRSWKFNVYNQRAKSGFKFWLEEKKPVNKSQKYTFGSAKTFLGLGNAPRN